MTSDRFPTPNRSQRVTSRRTRSLTPPPQSTPVRYTRELKPLSELLKSRNAPSSPSRRAVSQESVPRKAPKSAYTAAQPKPERPGQRDRRSRQRRTTQQPRSHRQVPNWLGIGALCVGAGVCLSLGWLSRSPSQQLAMQRSSDLATLPQKTEAMSFAQSTTLDGQVKLALRQEISPLQARVTELIQQYNKGSVGVFVLDLDNGDYVNWNGTREFVAASTIKLPLLAFFFQAVDRGQIELDESLVMTPEVIVGEAGTMQYQLPGTQFSALKTVTQMITVSDNTATNMVVERLGGLEAVNERFQQWGYDVTQMSQPLPDIAGTNRTTPVDLVNVLIDIEQGEKLSLRSRDRVLRILGGVVNNKLLASGIGPNAAIAHKTGTLGKILADAGFVDVPNGKRYLIVVMVERPHNDLAARALIQQISREVYQYFTAEADN